MKFSGFIKTSLINYPDKICSVVFTGGCNLCCAFCYNRELVLNPQQLVDEDSVLAHIAKRKQMVPAIVISGGEPAIHDDLGSFLEKLRSIGVFIKVDTNGFFPEKVKEWIDKSLVDYIAVDIKTSPGKYPQLTGTDVDFSVVAETVAILRGSSIDYELRSTVIPGFFDEEGIDSLGSQLGRVKKWFLQQYVNEHTIDAAFEHITPCSRERLIELSAALLPYADHCEVRGL